MNSVAKLVALVLVAAPLVCAQESLGDIARKQRTAKKPSTTPRVITNEDLDSSSPAAAPQQQSPDGEATSTGKGKATEKSATTDYATHFEKQASEYRKRVDAQKAEIALLQLEIAKLDHDMKVQSTNYYFDAGNRLRNGKAWVEQRQKFDKDVKTAQDKLAAAQQKLEAIREEARKLGIPASAVD